MKKKEREEACVVMLQYVIRQLQKEGISSFSFVKNGKLEKIFLEEVYTWLVERFGIEIADGGDGE